MSETNADFSDSAIVFAFPISIKWFPTAPSPPCLDQEVMRQGPIHFLARIGSREKFKITPCEVGVSHSCAACVAEQFHSARLELGNAPVQPLPATTLRDANDQIWPCRKPAEKSPTVFDGDAV